MTTTIIVPVDANTVVNNMGYDEWWLPCGCEPSDCVVAYAAKGASDYANSKVNLVDSGTHALTENGDTPEWDAINGWNINNNPLVVDIYETSSYYTMIAKYSDQVSGYAFLLGGISLGLYPVVDLGEGGPYAVGYGQDQYTNSV